MNAFIDECYRRLGNNVYQFRSTQRLTQDRLAEKSKVSGAYVSQIERADLHKGITCTAVFKMAKALNVPVCVLMANEPCQKYADCLSRFAVAMPQEGYIHVQNKKSAEV